MEWSESGDLGSRPSPAINYLGHLNSYFFFYKLKEMDESLLLKLPDSDSPGGGAWEVVNTFLRSCLHNHLGMSENLGPAQWFSLAAY